MTTYKITYETPDERIESDYFDATSSSEARYEFEFRFAKCKIRRIQKDTF